MGYTELDSILGQPIPDYVINQFYIRSEQTLDDRDDTALVYMANKSGWIRIISSVNISGSYADSIRRITNLPSEEEKLAKSFVLFGGTSAYTGKMDVKQILPDMDQDPLNDFKDTTAPRYEPKPYFDINNIDPTYGLRPIAGITGAKITTQGKLGSILQADIDFKVNTKQQLDVVDILYFKLGYTMFIEWGNTFFYKQKNNPTEPRQVYSILQKSEDYAVDPFEADMDEAKLRVKIAKSIRQTEGNYDAMVGLVTNFSFTSNTEGGYDCKLKVIGPGMLAESMRTNTIASLPETFKDAIGKIAGIITNINKNQAEAIARREYDQQVALITAQQSAAKNDPTNRDNYPPCVRDRLIANTFSIVTEKVGNSTNPETFAKDIVAGSTIKNYGFFLNKQFFVLDSAGNATRKNYDCDAQNNIIDVSDPNKPVIGSKSSAKVTYREFYEIINTDKDPNRYQRYPVGNRYHPKEKNLVDWAFDDKQQQAIPSQKHGFIFSKFNKVVYTTKSFGAGRELKPVGPLTIKLNLSPSGLGFSKNPVSWDFILGPGLSTNLETDNAANKTVVKIDGQQFLSGLEVTSYDPSDGINTLPLLDIFGSFDGDTTEYKIKYAANYDNDTRLIYIRYSNKFGKVDGQTYEQGTIFGSISEYSTKEQKNEARRLIIAELGKYLGDPSTLWDVSEIANSTYGLIAEKEISVNLPATINYSTGITQNAKPSDVKIIPQKVKIGISIKDHGLITEFNYTDAFTTAQQQQSSPSSPAGATIPPFVPPDYTKVNVNDLQNSEAAMYKSQMEGILRTIQLLTISRFINDNGEISKVSSIKWGDPKGKDQAQLYNILADGAFGNGNLQQIIEKRDDIVKKATENNAYYAGSNFSKKDRFLTNALFGFHRNLMKDDGIELPTVLDKLITDQEYTINFAEILQSFVIPYYQSKNLVEGGDIHYPTYVTMGFFFMILNHCGFLYDTTDEKSNIPLFYLDFNQGSNIILSSDFMLSANPYRFAIPFKGKLDSYKKLFDPKILKGDKIIAVNKDSDPTDLWTTDALSNVLPPFKFESKDPSGLPNYRGKLMNVLVSIDYLLDIIKSHATKDQTNSVYFRSLMDEILSDLGKSLGNFNVIRLAYDDYSNCFYVVDDQAIPGNSVINAIDKNNILNTVPYEIPVFGKNSIARSFTIQTDNSTRINNMLAISANSDVNNQTTAGTDGTAIGNSSLYAVNRYRKVTTAVNDNSSKDKTDSGSLERKALAASRFNESVKGYYLGGSRSEEGVEQATNYYIEAVAKARNSDKDPEIRATTLLPLSVNFSTDGISGMGIYHAFTIPENMLPYSYTIAAGGFGQNATRRIGFIVTGLDHTIQNNSWTTDVKANMYYVKNIAKYETKPSKQTDGLWKGVPKPVTNTPGSSNSNSGGSGTVPNLPDKAQAKAAVTSASDEIQAMKVWTAATEGCILYIQWDISNWRTGYGSGTITLADTGKNIKLSNDKDNWPISIDRAAAKLVTKSVPGLILKDGQQFPNGKIWNPKMSGESQANVITQADADANLEYRIKNDFLPLVKSTLSSRGISWDSLNIPMKVAFFKTSYAYGNISQGGKWIVDAYLKGGQAEVVRVAAAKAAVPNNSDYGADKIAYLLS